MKKIAGLLLVLLMLCAILIACAGKEDPSDSPEHVHEYGEWMPISAGSCSVAGEEQRSCACGATETRALTVSHSFNAENVCTMCNRSKNEIVLSSLEKMVENEYGALYFDSVNARVAYWNAATDEILFTNPVATAATGNETYTAQELASQLVIRYQSGGKELALNSCTGADRVYAIAEGVENGFCVGYHLKGAPIVVPERMEKVAFETKILAPVRAGLIEEYGESYGVWRYNKFLSYYNFLNYTTETREVRKQALAQVYPVMAEKNIDMYVLAVDVMASSRVAKREIADVIAKYCTYTTEDLKADYAYLEYKGQYEDWCCEFYGALSFVLDENGLTVDFAPQYIHEDGRVEYMIPGDGFSAVDGTLTVLPHLRSLNREDVHILCELPTNE